MKKIKLIYIALFAAIFSSCLDVDPATGYKEDDVWISTKNIDANVFGFYAGILHNQYVCELRSRPGLSEGMTDLIKFTRYNGELSNRFFAEPNYMREATAGTFSPYEELYIRIAQCNYFLIEVGKGRANHIDPAELSQRVGEVRFLRAFAYQELVKRHGGVIMRVSEEKLDGVPEQVKARSTAAQSWDFIIQEYKKATELLPNSWTGVNAGRITKGAAWGMMARAALYAGQWDIAIEAGQEVLGMGKYTLQADFGKIYSEPSNNEILLGVYFNQAGGLQHDYDVNYAPAGDGNVYVGGMAAPTDEFASSFDIKVGNAWKGFSWEMINKDGIDPWQDRDPRFYHTILYNGADWRTRKIELFAGGTDGFIQYVESGIDDARKSVTGYAFRKYLSTKAMDYTETRSDQYWIEMRLAEIYFIISEAYAKKENYDLAYYNLNILRTTRTSVQLPTLPKTSDWKSYLTDLQKERICELGLEGHRFWDIRRWKIGDQVLDGQRTHGVKITKNDNGTFKYERIESDVRDRLFPDRYHTVPIPYTEISANPLCVQDEIWR